MNINVQLLCGHMFSFFLGWDIWMKLLGRMVNLHLIFGNHHAVFQSVCANWHFHQQWMRLTVSAHAHHHLVLSVFPIIATRVGVKWYCSLCCRSWILTLFFWLSRYYPVLQAWWETFWNKENKQNEEKILIKSDTVTLALKEKYCKRSYSFCRSIVTTIHYSVL